MGKSTGESAGYDVGFSNTEGIWERLAEDACVRAIRLKSYVPYSNALVWALRDSRNRSDVREILLVSLQEQWRDFGALWLEQVVKPNPIDNSAPDGVTPAQPKAIGGNDTAKWDAIEVSFLSDERVQIRNDTNNETRNYAELGFADRRAKHGNPKPNQAWVTLRAMAEQNGIIRNAAKTCQDWPKVEKRVQEIRKVFRNHFGIDADPVPYVDGTGYKALFKIGCGPSYRT